MHFDIVSYNRNIFIQLLENLSLEQLTTIPKGYKNHILWNIGHTLVTEQLLTYGLSNLPLNLDANIVEKYKKGSFPLENTKQTEIEELISLLKTVSQQTKTDYESGVFMTFNTYKTSVGFTIKNMKDALSFNAYHEGIHVGIILSIKKYL